MSQKQLINSNPSQPSTVIRRPRTWSRKFKSTGESHGRTENGLYVSCPIPVPVTSKFSSLEKDSINVVSGQEGATQRMQRPLHRYDEFQIGSRLQRLEKNTQELLEKMAKMSQSVLSLESTDSVVSLNSPELKDGLISKSKRRRIRKEKLESMLRLQEAGYLSPDITLKDLPAGFQTRSPANSDWRFGNNLRKVEYSSKNKSQQFLEKSILLDGVKKVQQENSTDHLFDLNLSNFKINREVWDKEFDYLLNDINVNYKINKNQISNKLNSEIAKLDVVKQEQSCKVRDKDINDKAINVRIASIRGRFKISKVEDETPFSNKSNSPKPEDKDKEIENKILATRNRYGSIAPKDIVQVPSQFKVDRPTTVLPIVSGKSDLPLVFEKKIKESIDSPNVKESVKDCKQAIENSDEIETEDEKYQRKSSENAMKQDAIIEELKKNTFGENIRNMMTKLKQDSKEMWKDPIEEIQDLEFDETPAKVSDKIGKGYKVDKVIDNLFDEPILEDACCNFLKNLEKVRSLCKKNRSVTVKDWLKNKTIIQKSGIDINIPSRLNMNKKWDVYSNEEGIHCRLVDISPITGQFPGPSQYGTAADPSESRPIKKFRLSKMMHIKGLVYVDYELYTHLKIYLLGLGVSSMTHAKLHKEAQTFMKQYRFQSLDPSLYFEILHWTTLAAMIPTDNEIRGVNLIGKAGIFKDINRLARFRRKGIVTITSCFGLCSRDLSLNLD